MLTQVNAEGQCKKIQANQENVVAQKNAERVLTEGRGEEGLKGVLGLRRLYTQLNKKLDVVKQMGMNPELRIFGRAEDSAMTQLAAYQMSGSRI
jgi:copper homeostasis protein CutC